MIVEILFEMETVLTLTLTSLSDNNCWTTRTTCSTLCSNSNKLFFTASNLFNPVVSGHCSICCSSISRAGFFILKCLLMILFGLFNIHNSCRADLYRNLLTTFSKALSRIRNSKSWFPILPILDSM